MVVKKVIDEIVVEEELFCRRKGFVDVT